MKKLTVFTIAIMMVVAVYASKPIQVSKPAQNEKIFKGSSYMIKWIVTGQVHEFVKIRLFDKTGNTQIYKITDKTPSAKGQFTWPKNMIDNTDFGEYAIMVKTLDNNDWDYSGVFQIKKKSITLENNKEILKKIQDKPKFPISKEFLHLKPDLKIAVGPNIQPPYHNSFFNIVVSNIGKIATPVPTHDKLIFYYWGKDGNSIPNHLMEMIVTSIPVIDAGGNHVHIVSYKFTEPGKYTFSAHVNASEMQLFEESNILNNSNLPGVEFWVKY